ncbi:hypothetical protein CKAH01_11639 [Colletotrichum kahawae]|uniref:tyrosinase n=1 Tax=Colletotrichum kahawae TaxID=34407 RepID=A0AAE0DG71_COLKA|nr:hypothetical protein CKAH01_11639 [Colletotrichum kahawae]
MSYKIWLDDKPHSKEGHIFEATLPFNGQEIWGPRGAHENTSRLGDALRKADPRFDIVLKKKSHSVEGHVRCISVIHHGRLILNKLSTHDTMEGLVKAVNEKWAEGGTYGITGIPRPDDLQDKTINIPFVPEMPVRYNVEFLATEKKLRKQWTLFVLALEKFKNKPIQDKLSYFQIAGIHAAPYQPWDGAPRGPDDKSGRPLGYCVHNGLNFPTWHRPYMLLFEQLIWENMNEVVTHWIREHGLPDEEAEGWYKEAEAWRLPYWDWAAQQTYAEDFACPEVLVQGPVRIYPPAAVKNRYPEGGLYANPFWGFNNPVRYEDGEDQGDPRPFGDMPESLKEWNIPQTEERDDKGVLKDILPWDKVSGVSRYGLFRKDKIEGLHTERSDEKYTYRGLSGVNNAWQANTVFASMKKDNAWYPPKKETDPDQKDWKFQGPGTLSDGVNRMFCPEYLKTYEEFASTKWYKEGRPSGYLNLEYIHNNVHNLTGGNKWDLGMGHMSDVPVAAFDPVFWLHHCQIDRLLAIWQVLNWEKWWNGTKSDDEDPCDNRHTPLQPFHLKDNDPEKRVYTADLTRDWNKLGYSYDVLKDVATVEDVLNNNGTLKEEAFKSALRAKLDSLYPSAPVQGGPDKKLAPIPTQSKKMGDIEWFSGTPEEATWNDYIITVDYDRYAGGGSSYSIEFFLGGPRAADATNNFHPLNYIGCVYTFAGGQREKCGNCSNQAAKRVKSRGQLPLTVHILQQAADEIHLLKTYEDDEVTKYLKEHLKWRFVLLGGKVVSETLYPDTLVTVFKGTGRFNIQEKKPVEKNLTFASLVAGFSYRMPLEVIRPDKMSSDKVSMAVTSYDSKYEALVDVTKGKAGGYGGE